MIHPFVKILLAAPLLGMGLVNAATIYVDVSASQAKANGSEDAPYHFIQAAVDRAKAGDTVLVAPGVYYEAVRVLNRGTADAPITIKAAEGGLNTVTVTGARQDVREGDVKWDLVDEATQTYRIAHQDGFPSRVLYGNIDLFPYPDTQTLHDFQTILKEEAQPRPFQGYTYVEDEGALYIRLHQKGKYGSTDPNDHTVAIGPEVAGGFDGTLVRKQADYNIGVLGEGPAHVIIDGFTLETPGVAGVYVEGSDVTVRNCWFRGCRTGVSGNMEENLFDPEKGNENFFNLIHSPELLDSVAARIIIEYCDFTQEPTYSDVADIIEALPPETDEKKLKRGLTKKGVIYAFWTRKDPYNGGLPNGQFKYEIGIANRIGRDWTIRNNYIHNVFEGLSCHSVSESEGLQVLNNVFDGCNDNAIELEDHSYKFTIRGNVIRNALEPLSYQPLRGEPWPTAILIERNLVYNTEDSHMTTTGFSNGVLKWGITRKNWNLPQMQDKPIEKGDSVILPEGGVDIRQNGIFFPGMLVKNVNSIFTEGYNVHDNVIVTESFLGPKAPDRAMGQWQKLLNSEQNFCAPYREEEPGPGNYVAGEAGETFPSVTQLLESPKVRSILEHLRLVKALDEPANHRATEGDTFQVMDRLVFRYPKYGPQR